MPNSLDLAVTSATIVSDPEILTGMPVVGGTRVPAETIMASLEAGMTVAEILEDYPSLPADGIRAAQEWARQGGRQHPDR